MQPLLSLHLLLLLFIAGVCTCYSGWEGDTCEKGIIITPYCGNVVLFIFSLGCSSGFYGPGCTLRCPCYGRSLCNPITGVCQCPPGYTGFGCWQGMSLVSRLAL
jgi:hypothetical protein